MALNSSGPISLAGTTAGQSIELENGGNGTTQISLNDTAVRALAGVTTPNSTIIMPTNFWGKSNYYTVDNSMRYRSSASAYLNRTPGASGNNQKFTFSTWVKKSVINANGSALLGVNAGGGYGGLGFSFGLNSNDDLGFSVINTSSANQIRCGTAAVFRDPSAWYHIVLAVDTTQATNSNGVKIYVNGVQQTLSFSTYVQNTNCYINLSGYGHLLGAGQSSAGGRGGYLDAYQAETYLIDGQQLTPSSFGATNANTGVWQPAQYAGTYGTNGFYLKFSDIATTSGSNAGLGKDFSGNGNYWTTNNISVTSGATYDAMTDSPTWKSSTVANYATWNPLVNVSSRNTFSNGNLTVSSPGNPNYASVASLGMSSGKWYCELSWDSGASNRGVVFGITNNPMSTYNYFSGSSDANSWTYSSYDGTKNNNGSASAYGSSYTLNDIIGIAFDADAGTLTFYKNNVSQGTAFTGLTSGPYFVMAGNGSGSQDGWWGNFGQRPFTYTPPTGFNRMQTYNLATPTIGATASTLASKYFAPVAYTGNGIGNTNAITTGFQPDFVWIKSRNQAYSHVLADTLRGNFYSLRTNSTEAQYTFGVNAFNSTGFTVGNGNGVTNATESNDNAINYGSWSWNGGGSTVTNTSGTISSQVRANTTCGFSVVKYTGNGTQGATVGHGLGVAPKMIFIKNYGAGEYWYVYNEPTYTGTGYYLWLNTTDGARSTNAGSRMPSAPTSSIMTLGNLAEVNGSQGMIAYCFAEVAGFSKIGKYTGNGSADGTFVYCGFRPSYIIMKATSTGGAGYNWFIYDVARNTYNVANGPLFADLADGTGTGDIDILSNGFKIRNGGASQNGNGVTYTFMAFAESPFNYSLAR